MPHVKDINIPEYMSEECELLTLGGWKRISHISILDIIATYDIDTDYVKWQCPIDIIVTDVDHDIAHYETDDIDMDLSPGQSMLAKCTTRRNKMEKYEIIDLSGRYTEAILKKTAKNSFLHIRYFFLERINVNVNVFRAIAPRDNNIIYMNDWLEFVGVYISFGYTSYMANTIAFRSNCSNVHTLSTKIRFIQKYFADDFELEIKPDYTIILRSAKLYQYLTIYGYDDNRMLACYMLCLNMEQSRILLHNILILSNYNNFKYLVNYQTNSPMLADQLQILAFNAEYSSRILSTDSMDFKKMFLSANSTKKICVIISNFVKDHEPILDLTNVIYNKFKGKSYNIVMPNNICLVRKNKKYCWL
jgi:hypothetical protein